MRSCPFLLVLGCLLGCSTSPKENVFDAGEADAAAHVARAPAKHRATTTSCTAPALKPEPPSIVSGDGGAACAAECKTHADCTAHPNGRCIAVAPPTYPNNPECGTFCLYEDCAADDACGPGGVCVCSDDATVCANGCGLVAPIGRSDLTCACHVANRCAKAGNCRVDADCGDGGYCSPSFDGCAFDGYFCHTALDGCVDNSDCTAGSCLFQTDRWSCAGRSCP